MRGVVKLVAQSPVEDRTMAPPHPFTLSHMYWSEAVAAAVEDFPASHNTTLKYEAESAKCSGKQNSISLNQRQTFPVVFDEVYFLARKCQQPRTASFLLYSPDSPQGYFSRLNEHVSAITNTLLDLFMLPTRGGPLSRSYISHTFLIVQPRIQRSYLHS